MWGGDRYALLNTKGFRAQRQNVKKKINLFKELNHFVCVKQISQWQYTHIKALNTWIICKLNQTSNMSISPTLVYQWQKNRSHSKQFSTHSLENISFLLKHSPLKGTSDFCYLSPVFFHAVSLVEMPVALAKAHAVFVLPHHLKVDCAVAGKVEQGMCMWCHSPGCC